VQQFELSARHSKIQARFCSRAKDRDAEIIDSLLKRPGPTEVGRFCFFHA